MATGQPGMACLLWRAVQDMISDRMEVTAWNQRDMTSTSRSRVLSLQAAL